MSAAERRAARPTRPADVASSSEAAFEHAAAVREALALGGGAHALFTSRAHGNLSSAGGDAHERGAHARARVRAVLGLREMVRGYQVHGTTVGRVHAHADRPGTDDAPVDRDRREIADAHALADRPGTGDALADRHGGMPGRGLAERERMSRAFDEPISMGVADGYAVAAPGIAAMVLVADCVPVALACRGAVAALHAGWRGLAAGILEEGVSALRDVGGRGEIIAAIGPCAGVCCYEVGEEVHRAFGGAHRRDRRIDLRAIARERLLVAGVAEVRDVRACTICDERYFSHRREGPRAGRQAALAWLA